MKQQRTAQIGHREELERRLLFAELGGSLSGVVEAGTYDVRAGITVPHGESLTIQPGFTSSAQAPERGDWILSQWLGK